LFQDKARTSASVPVECALPAWFNRPVSCKLPTLRLCILVYRGKHSKLGRWDPAYGLLLLLVVVCSLILGPLKSFTAGGPLAAIAASVLLMLPGLVLAGLLFRRQDSASRDVLARVPLSFALSTGVFGVLALPPLLLKWNLDTYLLMCGGVLALSLAGAVFLMLRGPEPSEERGEAGSNERWLWLPLAVLTAVLGFASVGIHQGARSDFWAYTMYAQRFFGLDPLNSFFIGSFSRSSVMGWSLEQAAFSWASGVTPVVLLTTYLAPVLVVMSILAMYGLALTIFQNRGAALIAGCIVALFFLFHLDSSLQSLGTQFVGRITEDKFVVRFIFLPVALSLAALFLRERKLRHLFLFTFICWSVVSIHPIGLVLIGISVTGFGLAHATVNWRSPAAWKSLLALGAGMSSIVLPPLLYLLATDSNPLSILDKTSSISEKLLLSSQRNERLFLLGDGSYIMHPSLVLDPPILVAYLLGIPFLAWKAKRSLAAQLLLGTLLFTTALVYIPPLATLAGDIVGPWTIWRLAWPIPLAAILTLGWMCWDLLSLLRSRLAERAPDSKMVAALPVLFVCALIAVFAPSVSANVRSADERGEIAQDKSYCLDPIFPWMNENVTNPTVILAPDAETSCFAGHMAEASYVSYRGAVLADGAPSEINKPARDVENFFGAETFDGEMLATLERYAVDYVLIPAGSPLNRQLEQLPFFASLDTPGHRYRLYEVRKDKLLETPLLVANGYLNDGEGARAIEAYASVPAATENEEYLVYAGLGEAYLQLDRPEEAVANLEQAVRLSPKDPASLARLAKAYTEVGDTAEARGAMEKAVSLAPWDVSLRFKLAELLQKTQEEKALEQYETVVERYPDVPEYRIRYGESLNLAGEPAAADEQFEQAIRQDPRSSDIYGSIAGSYAVANRPRQAAANFEEALDLAPDKPTYSLRLGQVYLKLWKSEKDEDYLQSSEEALLAVSDSQDSTEKQRARSKLVLGKVYERWNKPEEAIEAYKQALKETPNSKPARQSVERLERKRAS